MNKTNRGFTLLEVMVATTVLSLGMVLIYQSFFTVLRGYDYCVGYVASSSFAHQKLWEAADNVKREGVLPAESSGEFARSGKDFEWGLSQEPAGENLYRVSVLTRWRSGKRVVETKRSTYALYEKSE